MPSNLVKENSAPPALAVRSITAGDSMYGKISVGQPAKVSSVAARGEHKSSSAREGLPGDIDPAGDLLKSPGPIADPAARVVVRSGGRILFLRVQEIDWVESAGNYVFVHVGNETHRLRETMSTFAARLDLGSFLRIHRSLLVNIECIREVHPWRHGKYVVVLRDGTRLPMSRGRRDMLHTILRKDK